LTLALSDRYKKLDIYSRELNTINYSLRNACVGKFTRSPFMLILQLFGDEIDLNIRTDRFGFFWDVIPTDI